MSDRRVEKCYVEAGRDFGDAVSYIYMGECIGFADLLAKWEKWEAEYAKRGYRLLSIDEFVEFGGWGQPLKDIGVKRVKGEAPIFHAKIYRQVYLGKIKPTLNIPELLRPLEPGENVESRIQTGTVIYPTTKKSK